MATRSFLILLFVVLDASTVGASEIRLEEVGVRLGIDFEHSDYRTGEKYYVETTGSGGGWLDFDGDGDLDLYLIDGAPAPGSSADGAGNRLYERRDDGFVDVTDSAGVRGRGFGMGMCVGDVDSDGLADFMVTNYGPDHLFRNLGGGRFEEVSESAGVSGSGWSSSCAFGDLDGDGDLDLYVTHYLEFRYSDSPSYDEGPEGQRWYLRPLDFAGVSDVLFLNDGSGRFVEEGAARGLASGASERSLGVILSDLDVDGDLDIYVANDGSANRLYRNDGKGRFEDVALLGGAALDAFGAPEAGMGIDVADVDGDTLDDLLVTHFSMQTNTLYAGRGDLQFDDVTERSGLGRPGFRNVSWGVRLVDLDNDGDQDVVVANGHMQEDVEKIEPGLTYRQANQVFQNLGDGRFREVSEQAGASFAEEKVSRGLATGDFDDDGRVDVLITNTNDRVTLLRNVSTEAGRWLGISLVGPPENAFAIGARVEITYGEATQSAEVRSGGSFQSQSDLRLHFGLGDWSGPVRATVYWPDGSRQQETTEGVDRYWELRHPRAGTR